MIDAFWIKSCTMYLFLGSFIITNFIFISNWQTPCLAVDKGNTFKGDYFENSNSMFCNKSISVTWSAQGRRSLFYRLIPTNGSGTIAYNDLEKIAPIDVLWYLKLTDSSPFLNIKFNNLKFKCGASNFFILSSNDYSLWSNYYVLFLSQFEALDLMSSSRDYQFIIKTNANKLSSRHFLFYLSNDASCYSNDAAAITATYFNLTYSVSDCSGHCSSQGICKNHTCYCFDDYFGDFCQYHKFYSQTLPSASSSAFNSFFNSTSSMSKLDQYPANCNATISDDVYIFKHDEGFMTVTVLSSISWLFSNDEDHSDFRLLGHDFLLVDDFLFAFGGWNPHSYRANFDVQLYNFKSRVWYTVPTFNFTLMVSQCFRNEIIPPCLYDHRVVLVPCHTIYTQQFTQCLHQLPGYQVKFCILVMGGTLCQKQQTLSEDIYAAVIMHKMMNGENEFRISWSITKYFILIQPLSISTSFNITVVFSGDNKKGNLNAQAAIASRYINWFGRSGHAVFTLSDASDIALILFGFSHYQGLSRNFVLLCNLSSNICHPLETNLSDAFDISSMMFGLSYFAATKVTVTVPISRHDTTKKEEVGQHDLIYVHGGLGSSSVMSTGRTYWVPFVLSGLAVLNATSMKWRRLSPSPVPLHRHTLSYIRSSSSDGFLYALGGCSTVPFSNSTSSCYSGKIYIYNIACDVWLETASTLYFPIASLLQRYSHATQVVYAKTVFPDCSEDDKLGLLVFGGHHVVALSDVMFIQFVQNCSSIKQEILCFSAFYVIGLQCVWSSFNNQCVTDASKNLVSCFWIRRRSLNNGTVGSVLPSEVILRGDEGYSQACNKLDFQCQMCTRVKNCYWNSIECLHQDLPNRISGLIINSRDNPCADDYLLMHEWCLRQGTCSECTSRSSTHSCVWCQALNVCMALFAVATRLFQGQCRALLIRSPSQCNINACETMLSCEQCRNAADLGCGWCEQRVGSEGLSGAGLCVKGGVKGPVVIGANEQVQLAQDLCSCPNHWHFQTCPTCQCNGHASCVSNSSSLCNSCQHNTQGDHCQQCSQGYYGNALNAGICKPCTCLKRAWNCSHVDGSCQGYCYTYGETGEACNRCMFTHLRLLDHCYAPVNVNSNTAEFPDGFFHHNENARIMAFVTHTDIIDQDLEITIRCTQASMINVTYVTGAEVANLFKTVSNMRSMSLSAALNYTHNIALEHRNLLLKRDSEKYVGVLGPCGNYKLTLLHKDYMLANTTFFIYVHGYRVPFHGRIYVHVVQSSPLFLGNFFIAFFICFTGLVIIGGVILKLKRRYDNYRRRVRAYLERQRLAKRPFGHVNLQFDSTSDNNNVPIHNSIMQLNSGSHCGYVTLQPLHDQRISVLTTCIILPAAPMTTRSSPMTITDDDNYDNYQSRLCFGSVLLQYSKGLDNYVVQQPNSGNQCHYAQQQLTSMDSISDNYYYPHELSPEINDQAIEIRHWYDNVTMSRCMRVVRLVLFLCRSSSTSSQHHNNTNNSTDDNDVTSRFVYVHTM